MSCISAPNARADVVVPVGQRPAAVLESAVAVFVLSARRLHHAVQRHELGNDQLSHWMTSPAGIDAGRGTRLTPGRSRRAELVLQHDR